MYEISCRTNDLCCDRIVKILEIDVFTISNIHN